jgi:hypothetical protein
MAVVTGACGLSACGTAFTSLHWQYYPQYKQYLGWQIVNYTRWGDESYFKVWFQWTGTAWKPYAEVPYNPPFLCWHIPSDANCPG